MCVYIYIVSLYIYIQSMMIVVIITRTRSFFRSAAFVVPEGRRACRRRRGAAGPAGLGPAPPEGHGATFGFFQ